MLQTPKMVDSRTQDIHRQVFIKIASEQIKGEPQDIINYAKILEEIYDRW